jgi:hypothetical protein
MALVQAVASDQGSSGGVFSTTISASASGSAIIVALLSAGGFSAAPTVTDNKSNTYTKVVSDENNANVSECAIFVCPNAIAGVTSVTVNNGGKLTVFVCEESSLVTSGVVDKSAIAVSQAFTTTPTTANVTTTSANEVAYSFVCYGNGTVTFSAGTGYTAVSGTGITSGQHNNTVIGTSAFLERQVLSSTSTIAGISNSSPGATGIDSALVTLILAAQTNISPLVGSVSTTGNTPTVTPANNTVIQTFVA